MDSTLSQKEMTESYSVFKQIKRMVKRLQAENQDNKEIIIIDVCSGKGFLAILLSFMLPQVHIYMIDNDLTMNIQ